jgi:APA family basic amino acid/polyamine antiporter
VLVLRRRFAGRADVVHLPLGPAIPLAALLLSLALMASATWQNLAAAATALAAGALVYRFWRRPA